MFVLAEGCSRAAGSPTDCHGAHRRCGRNDRASSDHGARGAQIVPLLPNPGHNAIDVYAAIAIRRMPPGCLTLDQRRVIGNCVGPPGESPCDSPTDGARMGGSWRGDFGQEREGLRRLHSMTAYGRWGGIVAGTARDAQPVSWKLAVANHLTSLCFSCYRTRHCKGSGRSACRRRYFVSMFRPKHWK